MANLLCQQILETLAFLGRLSFTELCAQVWFRKHTEQGSLSENVLAQETDVDQASKCWFCLQVFEGK